MSAGVIVFVFSGCSLFSVRLNFAVLHERDYVTFGSLLSQIPLSSVTFARPTQGVENFRNMCTLAIRRPPCEILRRCPVGTHPSGALNARGQQNIK